MIRIPAMLVALLATCAGAEPLRIASFNVELGREGPGLMLRDIEGGRDKQVDAVVAVIARIRPDILALQGMDWDHEARALAALSDRLTQAGWDMPHSFALRPNSGMASDLDLDGDGRIAGPGDSQGYGRFTGQNGIALLSRHRFVTDEARDLSTLLWRDLPGADLPSTEGVPFPSEAAQAAQRLSSTGHWLIPVETPAGRVTLLTYQAGPPVFDGPEDRNGLRNRDETRFWQVLLDGGLGTVPDGPFVLAGGSNLDPWDGEGYNRTMRDLLDDPRLRDPAPVSAGAEMSGPQGHRGPDGQDTVDWPGVGRYRVDYVLPSSHWRIEGSGVHWPAPGEPGAREASDASRHRLVWVDIALP
ncbi:endonuclease/exonuclease/phosphatase family protein [Ruegeria marina]|uniref:Endonuclease/Exonuclease/phosphatase family protein n=1 Tax=Ruegeria marina TaxID=639004 RepID=A0A1G6P480_9RHOB|nr:endonuclease/exonuclease/phosphatase family protein [Ruegeria marina]SDC75070.1 Endonuclease/Exonuclease/phosphatase family protein [Ruegeria marina]